jgi:hypothetical protein
MIDDDEDTGRHAGEKNVAASGRKPKVASSDPLFQLIWKRASKELKRSIFFNNPFPNSEDYELLPLHVYASASCEVSQIGCYKKEDALSRARNTFNAEWASSVGHWLTSHVINAYIFAVDSQIERSTSLT